MREKTEVLIMKTSWQLRSLPLVLMLACSVSTFAQTTPASDYLVPFPPHHVIGNVYFVGSKGLGIYLITTPQGNILSTAVSKPPSPSSGRASRS